MAARLSSWVLAFSHVPCRTPLTLRACYSLRAPENLQLDAVGRAQTLTSERAGSKPSFLHLLDDLGPLLFDP